MKYLILLLGLGVGTISASTVIVNIASEPADWLVTGAGASNAVPLLTGDHLSITSNEDELGTFVSGGSLAGFDGYWEASESFFLPLNSTSVSVSFAHLNADDRAVLELNGIVIGNTGNNAPGEGNFTFTDGGVLQGFDFTDQISGTVTTGFNFGGENSLEVIINNTGSGILGSTKTFQSTSDNTFFEVTGDVTYTTATPEPASAGLILAVAAVMLLVFIRREYAMTAPALCPVTVRCGARIRA